MLRARAETTEQAGSKELMIARGETAGHDRKPKHTISDTENYSPSDVGNDKAVQSLEDTTQGVVDGRK
jgi:hypothetical protein